MAHSHPHPHSHSHDHPSRSHVRLLICFWITAAFMIVEVLAGLATNSLALLSDSFHMLSDVLALGLGVGAARLSLRRPTAEKTFGFKRFEVVAAFANGLILILLSVALALKGAMRLWHPQPVSAGPMMIVAAIGLAINLGILAWLHDSHEEKNLNEEGIFWHVLGDALGSIAALLAGALMLWRGWLWADPVASLLIAVLLCFGAWRVLRRSTHILVEGVPEGMDVDHVRNTMLTSPQVGEVHDLHLWTLNGRDLFLSAHVGVVPGDLTEQQAVSQLRHELEDHFNIHHITLQSGQCEAGDCSHLHD